MLNKYFLKKYQGNRRLYHVNLVLYIQERKIFRKIRNQVNRINFKDENDWFQPA